MDIPHYAYLLSIVHADIEHNKKACITAQLVVTNHRTYFNLSTTSVKLAVTLFVSPEIVTP